MLFRQLFDSVSGTYSYLIASRKGGEALIIDPVLEKVDRYLQLVRELDLKLVKAVDTHIHADHITGLGALRRRPEARWRRTPRDLAALGVLQRELLASALDALAPGGVAVYATCSPHLAETTFVVGDVLKKRPDIEQVDARPVVEAITSGWAGTLGSGPAVQLWPHVHGTDGMFLAVLRKRA